jgi:hypothetical protein
LSSVIAVFLLLGCSDSKNEPEAQNTAAPTPAGSDASIGAPYKLGTKLVFGSGGNGEAYRGAGWSAAEPGHTWSDKPSATLTFQLEPAKDALTLRMRLTGMVKAPELPYQPVEVEANGRLIASWQVGAESDFTAVIPAELVKAGGTLRIQLKIPKSTSPKKLGLGSDDRFLGVSLSELEINTVSP